MALEASSPDDRARQLIALTERLARIMTEDAEAFEARRPHEAGARQEEAARLANLYRHESMKLRRQPALLAGLPDALKAKLADATRAFDAALARHARALEAARTVTEGLVRAIAEEVSRERAATGGYGPGARSAPAPAPAVALNRRA